MEGPGPEERSDRGADPSSEPAVSAFVDDDGMVVVRGRLDPEVGALFMRAVEAASDGVQGRAPARRPAGRGPSGRVRKGRRRPKDDTRVTAVTSRYGNQTNSHPDETTPEQRRADAVGLIAERPFAAGFGNGVGGEVVSGSRAERYQVMLHVDADTLKEDGGLGQSELEDGTRVTAVTSRRIACVRACYHRSRTRWGGHRSRASDPHRQPQHPKGS